MNLIDQFKQTWSTSIDNSSKALNYRLYKKGVSFENYLEILKDKNLFLLCRFRTSNHRLPIEIGRWPYEYENQTVKVHNVKGRLHKNIQFWKEKLLLAESSKNLVLPILEYGYLLIF